VFRAQWKSRLHCQNRVDADISHSEKHNSRRDSGITEGVAHELSHPVVRTCAGRTAIRSISPIWHCGQRNGSCPVSCL
jgi:hypothetical protein